MHSPRHKEPSKRLFALLGQDVPPSPASAKSPSRPAKLAQPPTTSPASTSSNTHVAVMATTRRSRGDKPLTRVMLPDQTETYEDGDLVCYFCQGREPPWRRNEEDQLLCKLCGLHDFRTAMERRQQARKTSPAFPSRKGKERAINVNDPDEFEGASDTPPARHSSNARSRRGTRQSESRTARFELESLQSLESPKPEEDESIYDDAGKEEEAELERNEAGGGSEGNMGEDNVAVHESTPQRRSARYLSNGRRDSGPAKTSTFAQHLSPTPDQSTRRRNASLHQASPDDSTTGGVQKASLLTSGARSTDGFKSRAERAKAGPSIHAHELTSPIIRLWHRKSNDAGEWWDSTGRVGLHELVRGGRKAVSRLRSGNKWIRRAQGIGFMMAILQMAVLAALCVPSVQRHLTSYVNSLLYLHKVRLPLNADFDNPEKYGLAPFKTRNLKIETADGELIGAWHVLPHSYYETVDSDLALAHGLYYDDLSSDHNESPIPRLFPPLRPFSNETFERAFRERCTILYFHGNAATRAMTHRVRSASDFSRHLDCNVLAIDYRGYGDSTGSPSEAGLLNDAVAAWRYVASNLEPRETRQGDADMEELARGDGRFVLVGHSLGTGVTAKLAGYLADRGVHPKSIVLVAPFVSIPELLSTYNLLGVPLLGHLRLLPHLQKLLLRFLSDTWTSSDYLVKTRASILLVHATDDNDIPCSHSERLFARLATARSARSGLEEISTAKRDGWGVFRTTRPTTHVRSVSWFAASAGGHNAIGVAEGVVDLVRTIL